MVLSCLSINQSSHHHQPVEIVGFIAIKLANMLLVIFNCFRQLTFVDGIHPLLVELHPP